MGGFKKFMSGNILDLIVIVQIKHVTFRIIYYLYLYFTATALHVN